MYVYTCDAGIRRGRAGKPIAGQRANQVGMKRAQPKNAKEAVPLVKPKKRLWLQKSALREAGTAKVPRAKVRRGCMIMQGVQSGGRSKCNMKYL